MRSLAGRKAAYAWTLLLVLGFTVLDFNLPHNSISEPLYAIPVVVAFRTSNLRFAVGVICLSIVLVILALAFSPNHDGGWNYATGHALAVGVIVVVGTFAVALARVETALRKELKVQRILALVGQAITHSNNPEEQFANVSAMLNEIVGHDRLAVALPGKDGETLIDNYVAGEQVGDGVPVPVSMTEDSGLQDLVLRGIPIVRNGAESRKVGQASASERACLRIGLKSLMAVPLVCQSGFVGVLNFRSRNENAYGPEELDLALRVSDLLSGMVANAQATRRIEEAHELLATSEENYSDLVESSHDLIWRWDAEGRFTYLNPAWERVLGYTVDEMLGRRFTDFQSPEIAERDIREFGRHLAGGPVLDYETHQITKSGEEVTLLFNAFPVTDAVGEIVATRGTARDVTGERMAQAGLRVRAAVVEATGDTMIVADANGIITLVNAAAEDMFGRSRDELVGSRIEILMPAESRAMHTAGLKRVSEGGAPHVLDTLVETEGLRADQTRFPIELRVSSIAEGDSAAFVSTMRDITDRRSLEATVRARSDALAESDARYRDLYENAPDMYVSVDAASGNVAECNKTVLRALGYRRGEVIGRPIVDLYFPESRKEFLRRFDQFRTTGEVTDAELKMQRKDGTTLDVSLNASAVRDAEGNIVRSRGTIRDITKRKKAEEELRIRLVALDAAADMVVITDPQGTVEYVNRAYTEETGYEPDDVIGRQPWALSGRQGPEFYRDLWDTVTAGKVWSGTLINHRKDGSKYPEEMTITPVAGEDGAVNHFIAIKRDISERLRVTAEREAARDMEAENRDLVRLNEARSEFLSSVSHELRTPLTSLLAFGDILSKNREGTMTHRQLEQLDLMRSNGWKLNELIEDLLDVSRAEAGTFIIEKRDFELTGMLREVTASADSIFEQKQQNLSVDVNDGPVWVHGDERRITQVMNNLLTNASKYSPDQSEIGIRMSDAVGGIEIRVTDNGIGIDKTDIARLFTPFFRVDNEQTRKEGGTGLGLVIAKTIAELHGGDIFVESTLSVGTTMRMFLPTISPGLLAVEGSANGQHPAPEKAAS